MQDTLQFQIRITVSTERAEALRADPASESYPALRDILREHSAALICQFDAFAGYVAEAEAMGTDAYPLYEWTRQTIADPEKKAKYLCSFTVYVKDEQVYDKDVADSLEAALSALSASDSASGIDRVFRYDTNPANNPQPPRSGR